MGLLAGKEEALAVRDAAVAVAPHRDLRRVAMLVVHSNPVAEPGVGDAGGMTVYVRQMARALAARGLEVDVYTRRDSVDAPQESRLFPLYAARPERIHVIPPGVDHSMFRPGGGPGESSEEQPGEEPGEEPGDREAAKALLGPGLGLAGKRVLLFVGRLQPLNGADTA